MDVSAGVNQGRIYRIARDGFEFKPAPKLGDLATVDLVKLYEYPNAWHRDTASRLIYKRQDTKAIPALKKLAQSSKSPLARVMAMYSLQGLSALEPELVIAALAAKEVPVKEHALKLAESFSDLPEMRAAVLPLAENPELRVRYQVAFTLGAFGGEAVTRKLLHFALHDGGDPWMQLAVLSSIGSRRGEFLSGLLHVKAARTSSPAKALLTALTTQIAAANARPELALFLKEVDALPKDEQPLAAELMRTIVAARPAIRDLVGDGKRSQAILAELMQAARQTAGDADKKPEDRAAAVRTLAAAEFADVGELFATLLQSQQPQPVQSATLETLARFDSDEIPGLLQAAWPSLTPQLRATAIETWFARPAWIGTFLDAVEAGDIPATDVDPARAALLEKSDDAEIGARAKKLFAGTKLARRQDVVDAYQSALDLKGDVDQGRAVFRKTCAVCHKLENFGESIGADLKAIKDRGVAAVMLNILDPNREVKPQFLAYVVALDDGTSVTGMIVGETANSLTIKKPDGKSETVLRINIDELKSTNLSFMPEGLEKQIDPAAMADLLAYLNAIE
jgi:putative heme-binding domain-containing protein